MPVYIAHFIGSYSVKDLEIEAGNEKEAKRKIDEMLSDPDLKYLKDTLRVTCEKKK
jgi:hypothetical protein